MTDINANVILIAIVSIMAAIAIYLLYAVMMFQGIKNQKGGDLQLATKNILEHVEVLFEKGEYNLVELLATKYLDRNPSHKAVRQYLAKAYFNNKKYNNCIKQCLVILKRESDNLEIKRLLGDCYVKKQMLNKAIKEYEEIFDKKQNDPNIVRTLAELYKETEQIFSAISCYNILANLAILNDEIAEIQLILAELNEEAKDYPAAFEAYKMRLEIYPTDISTNQSLVELYIKLKNHPKAIETLQYMLSFVTEPKILLWIYERLINLYVETEEFEKAIEYSKRMLEVQGSDKFKIQNDIATFNIKLNDFEKGITILEELVMMSQNGYDVTVKLAEAYLECKEFEKALEKYLVLLDKATPQEAKNIRNFICNLYLTWAIHKTEQEKYDESYQLLNEAETYNTLNPDIYYNMAINKMGQKQYIEAVELIHKALEYDKNKEFHVKYLLTLADAHHNMNHFFEEKKALSDLLKIDEKNPMGLYKSGLMYATQHDTKNAEECFKKALQFDPELLSAKFNLALLYEINNRDRAKELYIEILEEQPENTEAKRALADLTSSDY